MDFYSEGKFSSLGPLSWPHPSGLTVGTQGSCRGLVLNLAAHTLEESGFGLAGRPSPRRPGTKDGGRLPYCGQGQG